MLPHSFRTREGEAAYQAAKKQGDLKPLIDEPWIHEFEHWFMVTNRFPGDAVFEIHHLLLPKRVVATAWDLNEDEELELKVIYKYFLDKTYDVVYENMSGQRSIKDHYHLHCVTHKGE